MSNAPAADYAICILETLGKSPALMGISDISRETGINKNAVSRVLGSLVDSGWVYQEDVKYQLTLKPFRIASGALGRMTLMNAASDALARLWEKTGDSCYLAVLSGDAAVYLAHLDSVRDLKIAGRVGGSYPLERSAPGKVLLAYADAAYRAHYLREIMGMDGGAAAALEEKLAGVRQNGFATDVEEYGPGILCVAAPVFDMGGVAGAIGLSTSTVYCDAETLAAQQGQHVLAAAREISKKLGAEEQLCSRK